MTWPTLPGYSRSRTSPCQRKHAGLGRCPTSQRRRCRQLLSDCTNMIVFCWHPTSCMCTVYSLHCLWLSDGDIKNRQKQKAISTPPSKDDISRSNRLVRARCAGGMEVISSTPRWSCALVRKAELTDAKYSISLHVPASLHVGQAITAQSLPVKILLRQLHIPVDSSHMPPAEHGTSLSVRPPSLPALLAFHAASSNHATLLLHSLWTKPRQG